ETFWFRVPVRNESGLLRFALMIENPRIGLVELWKQHRNGAVKIARVGDTEDPTARVLARRPPAFRLRMRPGTSDTIYFRVQHHGSLQFRAWLWQERAYFQSRSFENVLDGLVCGAIGIMLIYH